MNNSPTPARYFHDEPQGAEPAREITALPDSEHLSAEEAYELLHAALVRTGSDHAARELKFWHDQANYWMGQYSNVIGEC